ncbi:hypothetical protein [Paraburkholderia atlantica]|uniref:hypothetical protein n=1 Tax=Paraburkholderia atlantica TaxID=2654982 RepID=UPI0005A1DBF3|nr:hypothetical protein [Paraburkholderia atlantica]
MIGHAFAALDGRLILIVEPQVVKEMVDVFAKNLFILWMASCIEVFAFAETALGAKRSLPGGQSFELVEPWPAR